MALKFKEDLQTSQVHIDAHLVSCHRYCEPHVRLARPRLTIKADTEDRRLASEDQFYIVKTFMLILSSVLMAQDREKVIL